MIIYNPLDIDLRLQRVNQGEAILAQIPAKYCFITGSFLFKEKYKDIDIFVISRTKKKLECTNKKAKINIIDFNDLHGLFYHSIAKSCIAKNILPKKGLKVTISDYWQVINEAVPLLLNNKDKFNKNVRFLMLYTEYFRNGQVLDTFQLDQIVNSFRNYKEIIDYVKREVPKIISAKTRPSYRKRFFYTQAGFYKSFRDYKAQDLLYGLTHNIAREAAHG